MGEGRSLEKSMARWSGPRKRRRGRRTGMGARSPVLVPALAGELEQCCFCSYPLRLLQRSNQRILGRCLEQCLERTVSTRSGETLSLPSHWPPAWVWNLELEGVPSAIVSSLKCSLPSLGPCGITFACSPTSWALLLSLFFVEPASSGGAVSTGSPLGPAPCTTVLL